MRRLHASLWLALAMLALSPSGVLAHAIGVDCALRGDKIEVEAFYDDDTPAIKAKVQVLNDKEQVVATGSTDEKGRLVLPSPPPGKYEVRVDAGAGHRKNVPIHVPDVPVKEAISEGPTRSEFTRIPWLNVLLGLAIIGGACGALKIVSYLRKNAAV